MLRWSVAVLGLLLSSPVVAQDVERPEALTHSIEELRESIGLWDVTTSFLSPDGTAARVVEGTYEFTWVVRDRVVSGKSEIPELGQAAGILFYVSETEKKIEMVSVAADGRLWIMAGPLGGEVRQTPEYTTPDGGTSSLRFTRFNVAADSFESKMEYSNDGGRTWTPGNHQRFTRRSKSAPRQGSLPGDGRKRAGLAAGLEPAIGEAPIRCAVLRLRGAHRTLRPRTPRPA